MTFAEFQQRWNYGTLDAQQCAAVQAVQGPVLLLAVPGSGKTTTLLARLGYLVHACGVPPRQILTCTYTVAATGEMRTRFAGRFGAELAAELEFRTINGVCARILSLYEARGHQVFRLLTDEGETRRILREIWLQERHQFPTEADLRGVAAAISYAKNSMLTPEQADEMLVDSEEGKIRLGVFLQRYNEVLQQNRWMDYDDQLRYAYAVLRREPQLLARMQARYRHFCVDEAQDTSLIQHRILGLLAQHSDSILMVGDEDQSIYGFRAACPDALMRFEKDWPGGRVLLMEQNYRSTPQIVAAADRFIRLNSVRRAKTMRTANPPGCDVQILRCSTRLMQYEKLTELAAAAQRTGSQTAILYRNNDTALPLIDALNRAGIAYQARGVDGLFFTSRILRDVRAILDFAADPCDAALFREIYSCLGLYLKRETVDALRPRRGQPVLEAVLAQPALPDYCRRRVRECMARLEQLRRSRSAAAALLLISRELGYRRSLEEREMDPFRLDILMLLAQRESTVDALLHRLEELEAIVRAGAPGPAAVVLSTIHSSKGLEYDRVVLADVIEGILPLKAAQKEGSSAAQTQLEEDRRLFYVGMTRARHCLTLVSIEEEATPFVDLLDPRHAPRSAPERPQKLRLPGKLPHITLTAAAQRTVTPAALAPFTEGTAVHHKTFGPGVILHREGDRVLVAFSKDRSQRTLSLSVAVPGGALRL